MALDNTVKATNIKLSFRKYIIDNIQIGEHIRCSFDADLTPPETQGVKETAWVSINHDNFDPKVVSSHDIRLICCTREDGLGDKLTELRDKVAGYLSELTRIDLYNTLTNPWTQIGAMMVYKGSESGPKDAIDKTKFWIIPITLKWGARV